MNRPCHGWTRRARQSGFQERWRGITRVAPGMADSQARGARAMSMWAAGVIRERVSREGPIWL